jgi:hypothetical protein
MGSLSFPLAGPLGGDDALTSTVAPVGNAEAGTRRLLNQFQNLPGWEAILSALLEQFDELEDSSTQLGVLSAIDRNVGAQLDNIGALIGEPREGFDDVVYRLHLKARVFLNKGSGTAPEILRMFDTLLGGAVDLRLEDEYPATFSLHTEDSAALDGTLAPYLATFLSQARAAGVRSIFHWTVVPPSETFAFYESSEGLGFDDGTLSMASDV